MYRRFTWLEWPSKIFSKIAMKTKHAGAQTTLYCALEPGLEEHSGKYFSDCQLAETVNPLMDDDELCKWLWVESEKLTHLNS